MNRVDPNVVILIKNLATLAPVRSDPDYQATATVVNVLLLHLSQHPFPHSDAVLEAVAKMIYQALFVRED
ncbi:MAG TPA: hypothetical protein VGF67_17390 [Ktedonobacteraceae bacterium]|jgi:hypothetical protein